MIYSELEELRREKERLLKKLSDIREDLKRNEDSPRGREIQLEEVLVHHHGDSKSSQESENNKEAANPRCYEILESILGVQFKDVEKNWIRDNFYSYKALVVTKAFRFSMDFTVDIEKYRHTIEDINFHFVDLDECYTQEIKPWLQRFAKEKNMSYLISEVSNYSVESGVRAKILWTLEKENYIAMEQCEKEGGGIYVHVHPPGDVDLVLLRFRWSLCFIDKTWRVEHIFSIDPIEAGEVFLDANNDLLEAFCQIGIRKAGLENLWTRLCEAIDKVSE